MSEFSDPHDPAMMVKDLINHIEECNNSISNLNLAKQKSEQALRDMLCHTKHGAHTHEFMDYKITITTGSNYSLDKNAYAEYLMSHEHIDSRFNIVKPVTKYELNLKALKDCDMYGTEQDRKLKDSFIKATEKKLHVKIIRNPSNDVYDFNIDSVLTDDINQ